MVKSDSERSKKIEVKSTEKWNLIKEEAVKHVRRLQEMYGGENYTIDRLQKKAANMKKKEGISDEVYTHMSYLIPELFSKNKDRDDLKPMSVLGQAIGYELKPDYSRSKGRITIPKEGERAVEGIKKIAHMNQQFHANGVRQSMHYQHNDHISLSAFSLGRHNPQMHIHPILFALFVNRIPQLERRVLGSNMARALSSIIDGRQPVGDDVPLVMDMTHDNNAFACDKDNIWNDLYKRVQVQEMLRELVVMFRNGQIYNVDSYKFLDVLNQCKMAPQETPKANPRLYGVSQKVR